MKKGLPIIVGVIVIMMMVLCLLAINANHSWIEFSTIFNGIMMPILTAVNVYVFVKLTKAISEKDEIRSRKELEYQKKILLMQLRKSEVDTFDRITSKVFTYDDNIVSLQNCMLSAVIYIESFYSSKLSLFDLEKDSSLAKEIRSLGNSIATMNNGLLERKQMEKDVLLNLFSQKNIIIQKLHEITLS